MSRVIIRYDMQRFPRLAFLIDRLQKLTDYNFIAEMNLNEAEIRTSVSRIGVKSFTVYHEAWQQGRLCVKGHAVAVYFDFKAKESVPIPEDIKKLLSEHLAPDQTENHG